MDLHAFPREAVEEPIVGRGVLEHRQDGDPVTESSESSGEANEDFLQAAERRRSHCVQDVQVALTFKANSLPRANFRLRRNAV